MFTICSDNWHSISERASSSFGIPGFYAHLGKRDGKERETSASAGVHPAFDTGSHERNSPIEIQFSCRGPTLRRRAPGRPKRKLVFAANHHCRVRKLHGLSIFAATIINN